MYKRPKDREAFDIYVRIANFQMISDKEGWGWNR